MDTSRAKNVIIALLLAFNVFLFVNTLIFRSSQAANRDTLENTRLILEQRGVVLECDIPSKPGGGNRLVYIKSELDRENIAHRLLGAEYEVQGSEVPGDGSSPGDGVLFVNSAGMIEFTGADGFIYTAGTAEYSALTADEVRSDVGEKEAEETAMKFMKEKGLLSGKYVLDRAVRNDDGTWVMDYIETYGGSLLFDNYFSVTVSGGRVIRLEYQRHQFRGLSGESTEQFEAYQALLAYFKEGSNIVITSIDSGYKLEEPSMKEVESVELLPVWRVKIEGMPEPVYISPHDT
ncbi:MAG: hypothetical protein GX477_07855 [Clostridiaceae bacterium]|nr:hypothetical protein [Clostridiaceae bacterium]